MLSSVVINLVHGLAATFWIGGMLFMKLVLEPAQTVLDPPQRGRLLAVVAKRFTIGAWGSALALLVTGVLRTPSGRMFDLTSTFGVALTVKHALIAVMIGVGLTIALVVGPRLDALAPAPGERPGPAFEAAQRRLGRLSAVNTCLGVLVLACVAVLTA